MNEYILIWNILYQTHRYHGLTRLQKIYFKYLIIIYTPHRKIGKKKQAALVLRRTQNKLSLSTRASKRKKPNAIESLISFPGARAHLFIATASRAPRRPLNSNWIPGKKLPRGSPDSTALQLPYKFCLARWGKSRAGALLLRSSFLLSVYIESLSLCACIHDAEQQPRMIRHIPGSIFLM